MPKLVYPSEKYKESFLEALQEYHAWGERHELNVTDLENGFAGFLWQHEDYRNGIVPEGKVPSTLYWLVESDEYIGRVSIRHKLNEKLKKFGGHLGYSIRPTLRGKGYGKKLIELVVPKIKALGIKKLLITTYPTNLASQRLIEMLGGVFEDEIYVSEEHPRVWRYYAELR